MTAISLEIDYLKLINRLLEGSGISLDKDWLFDFKNNEKRIIAYQYVIIKDNKKIADRIDYNGEGEPNFSKFPDDEYEKYINKYRERFLFLLIKKGTESLINYIPS